MFKYFLSKTFFFYRFTKFHIDSRYVFSDIGENIDRCPYDAVIVFESDVGNNNTENVFCGNLDNALPEVKSKTNTLYVQFISRSLRSNEGFTGEISFVYGKYLYIILFIYYYLHIFRKYY